MVAKRLLLSVRRWIGIPAFLGLTACHHPPAESDGHKITKAELVNGKYVNTVQATDKDVDELRKEAADMKKSTAAVTFTPAEQQTGK